jgi:hypothetical protein
MVRIPSDPPDDELTPRQLYDRFEEVTNLTASELKAFRDSDIMKSTSRATPIEHSVATNHSMM